MKITKLISSVSVFLAVLIFFSAVCAENLVDERGNVNCTVNFDVSEFGYSITNEAGDEFVQFTDNFSKYVAVMCLKAEDYITDLSIYSVDEIKNMAVYFGDALMEDDGTVNASFRLPSRSGKYTIVFTNGILGNIYMPFEYESKLYFDYDDALESGKESVLSFIEDNMEYIPINEVGYNLLSDEEKGKLVDILIVQGEVDNIDEFNNVFSSLPVENAIFQNTNTDTMLEYIKKSTDKDYSSFNEGFVDVFLKNIDEQNQKAILNDFVGKAVDEKMISDFKFTVLKSYVDGFEYFSQMEDVLINENNIWGFEQADIEAYNLVSNKNNVMNQMIDKLNIADNLEDYIDAFGDVVDAQKRLEDESKNSYNPQGSSSSSRGGSSGGSGGGGFTIKADSTAANTQATEDKKDQAAKSDFEDLTGFEWAADAINTLKDAGIINGVTEKRFSPADFVKREEFVKMICAALKITGVEYDVEFSDVDKTAWYYSSICAAVRAELIKGVSDSKFGIGQNISRQDAAVILKRMYDLNNLKIEKVTDITFNDENEISDYAYESVKKLVSMGIINGYEDLTFRPGATLTRAEAAVVIHKFMDMSDMLDK